MNKYFVKPWVGLRLLANFYSKVNMSRSKLKGSTGGILHWPSKALHRMSILWCTIAIKAHEVVSGIFSFKLNIDESLPEVTCCCLLYQFMCIFGTMKGTTPSWISQKRFSLTKKIKISHWPNPEGGVNLLDVWPLSIIHTETGMKSCQMTRKWFPSCEIIKHCQEFCKPCNPPPPLFMIF